MRVARSLPLLVTAATVICCAAARAEPKSMFTLGVPRYSKEKTPDNAFSIVVPIKAKMPELFKEPGLKVVLIVFDKPVDKPPQDLITDPNSYVVNFDEQRNPQAKWKMNSAQTGISGEALFYMGAPEFKSNGPVGVMKCNLRDLPDNDMGMFIVDDVSHPASNVLVFRRKNFAERDGQAEFDKVWTRLQEWKSPR